MTIEVVFLFIFGLIIAVLSSAVIFYVARYRRLIVTIAELIMQKEALAERVDMLTLENSKEVNEGFIKFLSDSRQSAFDYIEQVQMVIQNYLSAVENKNEEAAEAFRIELFSYLPEGAEPGDKNQG